MLLTNILTSGQSGVDRCAHDAALATGYNLEVPRHGISATGQEVDGGFYVFEGSLTCDSWNGTERGYQRLYN